MRKRKKWLRMACAAGMACLLASGCGLGRGSLQAAEYITRLDGFTFTKYPGVTGDRQPDEPYASMLAGYEPVCENRLLTLYLNQENAGVAVADRRSGRVWFSNTPTVEEDAAIDSDSRAQFYAQLTVEYMDGQNFKQLNSYQAAVLQGGVSYETRPDGLSVSYSFLDHTAADGGEPRQLFKLSLEYRLEEESLIVELPLSKAEYSASMPPLKIGVLPHFGGSNATGDGYLLIPDGSGALVEFSEELRNAGSYIGNVYGFDRSLDIPEKPVKAEQVSLPVFGVRDAGQAFLAIIEDGEAFAAVQASRAGPYSSFNEVFSSFTVHAYQNVSISGMSDSTKMIGIQDAAYGGSLRLRYAFLLEEEADYSGMAGYYRAYLIEKHGLSRLEAKDSLPLELELIGAINKLKSTLGIKYEGMEALTTARQAQDILQQLLDDEINNIDLRYTGWFNGGVRQELASSLKVEGVLGGKNGLRSLTDFTSRAGVRLYPTTNFLTTPSDASGFNRFQMSARQIDQNESRAYRYDMVSEKGELYDGVLSPVVLETVMDKFHASLKKVCGLDSLAIGDIGSSLFTDYTKEAPLDRQTTANIYAALLKKQAERYGSLLFDGGFSYVLPYADVLVNLSFSDSGYDIADRAVPFYQMVVHGYITYAGTPLNLSYDYETDWLRMVEYGGVPHFQLMAADGSAIKNTDYDMYCSNHFDSWRDTVLELYHRADQVLAPVQDAVMTKHEQLTDTLVKISYGNGRIVYVNYGEEPAQAHGVTVPGRDCLLV